jgi:hypothetical protein
VLQYPAEQEIGFGTDVVRFVDGSEQRFRRYASASRRWLIRLDLLDQSELHLLREFYLTQGGASQSFTFTDPRDGYAYTNCSFENGEIVQVLDDEMRGKTSVVVRQDRD